MSQCLAEYDIKKTDVITSQRHPDVQHESSLTPPVCKTTSGMRTFLSGMQEEAILLRSAPGQIRLPQKERYDHVL